VAAAAFALAAGGCTPSLPAVDASAALVACEVVQEQDARQGGAEGVVVGCNDELLVAAVELPLFADREQAMGRFLEGLRAGRAIAAEDARIQIHGEELRGARIAGTDDDGRAIVGSLVLRGRRLSSCVASEELEDHAATCARIHEAVLAGGSRVLLDAAAATSLPPAPAPPKGAGKEKGCALETEERGAWRLECEDRIAAVARARPSAAAALHEVEGEIYEDLAEHIAEEHEERGEVITDERAAELARASIQRSTAPCRALGQELTCQLYVADGWAVAVTVAQTRSGRRLLQCGAAAALAPGCPIESIRTSSP
jgi:hypothetical protein